MRKILPMVWVAIIVAVVTSAVVSAQTQNVKVKRVPVSVVLTSAFPYPGNVVILRRPESVPSDLIVMRAESATAETFSEAVRDLLDIRRVGGDFPQARSLLRTRPSNSNARRKLLPWAERVLGDVRGKPFQVYGEFANAQVVQIWLPPTNKAQ